VKPSLRIIVGFLLLLLLDYSLVGLLASGPIAEGWSLKARLARKLGF
jgi:hypothetical protein